MDYFVFGSTNTYRIRCRRQDVSNRKLKVTILKGENALKTFEDRNTLIEQSGIA